MNKEDFNESLEQRIKRIRDTLAVKGGEYATEGDRFHNFKRAAAITGQTPEQALVGMAVKHIVSLLDIVDTLSPDTFPATETIAEKCGDAINYFILLEAMLYERNAAFTKMSSVSQIAYDIWTATATLPGEGLEDVLRRIQAILVDYGVTGPKRLTLPGENLESLKDLWNDEKQGEWKAKQRAAVLCTSDASAEGKQAESGDDVQRESTKSPSVDMLAKPLYTTYSPGKKESSGDIQLGNTEPPSLLQDPTSKILTVAAAKEMLAEMQRYAEVGDYENMQKYSDALYRAFVYSVSRIGSKRLKGIAKIMQDQET